MVNISFLIKICISAALRSDFVALGYPPRGIDRGQWGLRSSSVSHCNFDGWIWIGRNFSGIPVDVGAPMMRHHHSSICNVTLATSRFPATCAPVNTEPPIVLIFFKPFIFPLIT